MMWAPSNIGAQHLESPMNVDDGGVEVAWHTFCLHHHRSLGFSYMAMQEAIKAYLQYVKDKNDRTSDTTAV